MNRLYTVTIIIYYIYICIWLLFDWILDTPYLSPPKLGAAARNFDTLESSTKLCMWKLQMIAIYSIHNEWIRGCCFADCNRLLISTHPILPGCGLWLKFLEPNDWRTILYIRCFLTMPPSKRGNLLAPSRARASFRTGRSWFSSSWFRGRLISLLKHIWWMSLWTRIIWKLWGCIGRGCILIQSSVNIYAKRIIANSSVVEASHQRVSDRDATTVWAWDLRDGLACLGIPQPCETCRS